MNAYRERGVMAALLVFAAIALIVAVIAFNSDDRSSTSEDELQERVETLEEQVNRPTTTMSPGQLLDQLERERCLQENPSRPFTCGADDDGLVFTPG